MNLWHYALGAGAILALLFLWSFQRSAHPFKIEDALMDPATSKASLNALILALMASLAAWVVVDREIAGKDDVSSILLGVLGIFVGGRVMAQGINQFKPAPDIGTTIKETVRERETSTTGTAE